MARTFYRALAETNGERKFRYNLPRDRRIINSTRSNAIKGMRVSFEGIARKLKSLHAA